MTKLVDSIEHHRRDRSNAVFLGGLFLLICIALFSNAVYWAFHPVNVSMQNTKIIFTTVIDHDCHVMAWPTIFISMFIACVIAIFLIKLYQNRPKYMDFINGNYIIHDCFLLVLGLLPIFVLKLAQTSLESFIITVLALIYELLLFGQVLKNSLN